MGSKYSLTRGGMGWGGGMGCGGGCGWNWWC